MTPISLSAQITKTDDEQHVAYAWLSVAENPDGTPVVDLQGDIIDAAELEKASHEFMADYRVAGDNHERWDGVGTVVSSLVTTREIQKALGVPPGTMPVGWLVGVKVADESVWQRIKSGELAMMSIGASGTREDA